MISYSGPHLSHFLLLGQGCTAPSGHSPATCWCSPDFFTAQLCVCDWESVTLWYLHICFQNAKSFLVVNPSDPLPPVNTQELLPLLLHGLPVYTDGKWQLCQASICNICLCLYKRLCINALIGIYIYIYIYIYICIYIYIYISVCVCDFLSIYAYLSLYIYTYIYIYIYTYMCVCVCMCVSIFMKMTTIWN